MNSFPDRAIAITGHRPKDLPSGYGMRDIRKALVSYRPDGLHPRGTASFITGGALGIDQLVAEFALNEGLYYEMILPFHPAVQSRGWSYDDNKRFYRLIDNADRVEIVGGDHYDVAMYQRRNERMVDRSDGVFAFWSGKPYGGTTNCIRYALKAGKKVWNFLPDGSRYENIGRPINHL